MAGLLNLVLDFGTDYGYNGTFNRREHISNPMDFIRTFIKFFDSEGIYDEFDQESQKMQTSAGVMALVKEARSYLPVPLKPMAAARAMRELPEGLRDQLIKNNEDKRVIDMRAHFARKQATNGGNQEVVRKIVDMFDRGDFTAMEEVITTAKALVDGPETVYNNKEDI